MYLPIVFFCSFLEFDELLFIPIIFFVTSKNFFVTKNIVFCGTYPKMSEKYKRERPKEEKIIEEKHDFETYKLKDLDTKQILNYTKRDIHKFKYNFWKNLNEFRLNFFDYMLIFFRVFLGY